MIPGNGRQRSFVINYNFGRRSLGLVDVCNLFHFIWCERTSLTVLQAFFVSVNSLSFPQGKCTWTAQFPRVPSAQSAAVLEKMNVFFKVKVKLNVNIVFQVWLFVYSPSWASHSPSAEMSSSERARYLQNFRGLFDVKAGVASCEEQNEAVKIITH